jgi:hypothetical protein
MSQYKSLIDNLELGDITWDQDGDGVYRDVKLNTGEFVPVGSIDKVALNKSIATGAIHRAISNGWMTTVDDETSAPAFSETDLARVFLADATSAVVTVTLPAASVTVASGSSISGKTFYVKKMDASANAVVVSATVGETIDGSNTYSLTNRYDFVHVISDGTNWQIVASSATAALASYSPNKTSFSSGVKAITDATGSVTVTLTGWGTTYKALATFVSTTTLSAVGLRVTQANGAFSVLVVNTVGNAVRCDTATATVNYLAIKDTL